MIKPLSCFEEAKWCNLLSLMPKCGRACRWSAHSLSDVWARGRGFLLASLFQQRRIKGYERIWNIHRVSLTGTDMGAPHSRLMCQRKMGEGNICTSVIPSVIKRGWACCCASKEGTASESSENKFMWESGRCLRFRTGLVCRDKKCVEKKRSRVNVCVIPVARDTNKHGKYHFEYGGVLTKITNKYK